VWNLSLKGRSVETSLDAADTSVRATAVTEADRRRLKEWHLIAAPPL
jgi:hypothetical protein